MTTSAVLKASREWRLLWGSGAVSVLGTAVATFAIPLAIYQLTRSLAPATWVMMAGTIAGLVASFLGGAFVDRRSVRGLMIVTNLVQLAASVLLAVALLAWHSVIAVAISYMIIRASARLYAPASTSLLRDILPPEILSHAATLNHARQGVAAVLGPTIGASLLGLSVCAPFILDGLSYGVAAVGVVLIGARPSATEPAAEPTGGYLNAVYVGLRYVATEAIQLRIISFGALINLVMPALVVVINLALANAGVRYLSIGVIDTVAGVATVIGAISASPLRVRLRGRTRIVAPMTVCLGGLALITLAGRHLPVIAVGMAMVMLPMPVVTSIAFANIIAITPRHLQGRVSAAGSFGSSVLAPFGPPLAGASLLVLGDTATRACLTTLVAIAGAILLPVATIG